MTDTEFDALLADTTKRIADDIVWREDEDHSPAVEFRVEVASQAGYPLFVVGRCNQKAKTLNYVLIHRGVGRIYALDLGKDHHNPSCHHVGERHKHRWTERFGIKDTYVPNDVTAPASDPVGVWQQFCAEAGITHTGQINPPPPRQEELFQ
jgi:hypothetical protein